MKKYELIDRLLEIEDDPIILLAVDSEGNGFTVLTDTSLSAYNSDNKEVGLLSLTDELKKVGFSEEDVLEGGEPAIILWP